MSYQLPVKLIKLERKDTATPSAADKAGGGGGGGLKRTDGGSLRTSGSAGSVAAAADSAFTGLRVKFNPNDIDIGEDSDNEDTKAKRSSTHASNKHTRGFGFSGGFGKASLSPSAADSGDAGAGSSEREARYAVQWDDARNFLSNLRVMQAQSESKGAGQSAGAAQGYAPSDVIWVGVPNIQTEDKAEMEEIRQLLDKRMAPHATFLPPSPLPEAHAPSASSSLLQTIVTRCF